MTRYIGIDVAKLTLDIAIERRVTHIANSASGMLRLTGLLKPGDVAVMEATGGYERLCARTLRAKGFAVAVVNPADVAHFRKGLGLQAKTDAIDAKALARFGEVRQPAIVEAAQHPELAELVTRRSQLVGMRCAEKNRLEHATNAPRESVLRHITLLQEEIQRVEAEIEKLVVADKELTRKRTLLLSAPGVGPTTALTLLATMPELGKLSPRKIASLAGLAPHPRESGAWKGRRSIGRGRPAVRRSLFMAVLGGTRGDNALRKQVIALKAAGKAPKQAIVACARKLLVSLNAMLRDGVEYEATRFGTPA